MQINVNGRGGTVNKGNTIIGPLKKQAEMLDIHGNVIDRKTKQVLKFNQ